MRFLIGTGIALSFFCLSIWTATLIATSRQESAVWNSHEIIDVHGHIGTFKGYDLSNETLLDNILRYGINLVLISNIDGADLPETRNLDETSANRATRDMVKKHPDRLRGLAWARPVDGSSKSLEPFLSDSSSTGPSRKLFVGMKLHPMMNHFPADDPRVDPYLALCEKWKIPAVFHCDKPGTNGSPEKIYAAARRHPSVPVILYHMVFFGPHSPAIEVVKESIRKNDAQLYLETAQAKPEDVLKAVRELGSDRVLFGTDATYYGKEHYARYEALVRRLRSEIPAKDFANVMRENAKRLFKLKLAGK